MGKALQWAGAGVVAVLVAVVAAVACTAAQGALTAPTVAPTVAPSPTAHCPTEDSCVAEYYGRRWHIREVTP